MMCCGYDESSKMLILQNHWGTIWGLKGFFLCPYDVWVKQNNLICWYERVEQQVQTKPSKKTAHVEQPKVEQPKVEQPPKEEKTTEIQTEK